MPTTALVRPTYLKPANTDLTSKLSAGLGFAQPPRITLKDDRFTILTAQGEPDPRAKAALTIDVIVIGGNDGASRIYYAGGYDSENATAPTCFSDNGIGPSENAQQPQHVTCAACPRAVWDQINAMGHKVPACSTTKKLAVLAPVLGDPTVLLLSVPPASLKIWRNYLAHLGQMGASPDEVITRVSLENKRLGFEVVDWIPQGVPEIIARIVASGEPDIVSGNNDKPIQALTYSPQADNSAGLKNEAQEPKPMFATSRERADAQVASMLNAPQPAMFTQPAAQEEERTPATMEELKAEIERLRNAQTAEHNAKVDGRRKPAQKKTETVNGRTETTIGAGTIPQGSFLGGGAGAPVGDLDQSIEAMLNKTFGVNAQ